MDFEKEVLEQSRQQPILVDFWAPWCGPCQFLGPVLEELEQAQEKWKLVKVNTDEHQELGAKYGIRGIPDVRLFADGQELAKFTGALPKHEVEKWLAEHLPDERHAQLEGILQGKEEGRFDALEQFVATNPDFVPGCLALARLILWNSPEEATSLVSNIHPGDKHFDTTEAIKTLADLLQFAEDSDIPVVQKIQEAKAQVQANNLEAGTECLIEAVALDKSYAEDLPRKACIAMFNFLGPDHEVTQTYRRRFDMALY